MIEISAVTGFIIMTIWIIAVIVEMLNNTLYGKLLVLCSHNNIANVCIVIISIIITLLIVNAFNVTSEHGKCCSRKSNYVVLGLPISIGIVSAISYIYYAFLNYSLQLASMGKERNGGFLSVLFMFIPIVLISVVMFIIVAVCSVTGIALPIYVISKSKVGGTVFLYTTNIVFAIINCADVLPELLKEIATYQ